MNYSPNSYEAYQLLHEGVIAMSHAEQAGIRVDLDYLERKIAFLKRRMIRQESEFKETDFYKRWQHSSKGKVNINSDIQLGHYLYNVRKITPAKLTVTGKGSVDTEALQQLNIPELNLLLEKGKLKKTIDVLEGFKVEQVDGYIHPFFNLHLARTYRSCIAKGTPILAARDFEKYQNGVPIEKIKVGDYVYCFNNHLNPTIQKVLWTGKTGHQKVIRVHYVVKGGGGKGFIDVTPEHTIRLIDGTYEQAQNLIGDFRKPEEGKRLSKIRTLSCKRVEDTLRFTGHLKNGNGILEHQFIYKQLIGKLLPEDIIHHKNLNHLDHTPANLEKTNLSDHSRFHVKDTLLSPQGRVNSLKRIKQDTLSGTCKARARRGWEHPRSLKLSKYTCLKQLAKAKGQIVKVSYNFGTIKKYIQLYNINPWIVRVRYDKNNKYIWKKELIQLSKLGRAAVSTILGHNYYKLIQLYKFYDLPTNRIWANQFGRFAPGNHIITKIEWLKNKVDVYDIEVEKYHNFFANQICVHNSSSQPNFQNIPKRDEQMMQTVRKALVPRPGHQFLEIDYGQLEVKISACYNKDPMLIKYVSDPKSDMHGDLAKQLFIVPNFDKKIPEHYILRQATKNGFVFPEFYGSWYKNCAINLACNWGKLPVGKWSRGQGIPLDTDAFTLSDHLIAKGINSLNTYTEHVKKIEKDFWGNRFYVYAKWKEKNWREYLKTGYIDLLTGFRCSGVMDKKAVNNYGTQGAAFHCLLWSFIELDKVRIKEKWDTKLVGQIHDSIILDTNKDEVDHVIEVAQQITTKDLPETWKWIIVPLEVEIEVSPINHSWASKETLKI